MEAPFESPVDEIARLRGCLNDVVGIMALPAVWAGGEPDRIGNTLVDALLEMLDLAFVFVRLNEPETGGSKEIVRFAESLQGHRETRELRKAIDASRADGPLNWSAPAEVFIGDMDVSVASARLGLDGEIGMVVVGSERRDFPAETERLLLELTANQATICLQQAFILKEQKRVTRDLDERVAQRTKQLATANELLKNEIAERRRTEDALRESERDSRLIVDALRASELNLRQMTETVPEMLWSATPDGAIEYCNTRFLNYTGLSAEDIRGDGWQKSIHPEDAVRVAPVWMSCVATGAPYRVEVRTFHAADRTYRLCAVNALPLLDENGRIVKWHGSIVDMHDQKQAQHELQRAHDHLTEAQRLSQTGSFSVDLERDEGYWSDEFYRICEFEPGSPVTIRRLGDIVHPEDASLYEAAIGRAMAGTEPDFYFRIVTSRGIGKHLRGFAHRIADRPVFVGAVQDVTASKIAQEALIKAGAELAHVSRVTSLSALTASVAHEVNQPLSGIMTNAGTCVRMLDSAPPDIDGARETARRTIRDANRASEVISRLRALFSKKELTLEPLDLNEATREVIALSSNDLQRNRIILRSELADELPIVTGDRIQLQQVVLNLLRNASDAMVDVHDRPRQLLLRTLREDGREVRLTVRDVGVGVSPVNVDSVFHAFYTTKSGGMGIGLFVSRSIVERHHGRLWVEPNSDGPGATFSFSIPVAPESIGTHG